MFRLGDGWMICCKSRLCNEKEEMIVWYDAVEKTYLGRKPTIYTHGVGRPW